MCMHIRPLKAHAARRQPINVRRFDLCVAVTAQMVVQIVYGNEQHIRLARLRPGERKKEATQCNSTNRLDGKPVDQQAMIFLS